jgi:hypothetical protein
MARVKVNRSTINTSNVPVIPGEYEVECIKAEPGESKAGNAKLKMEYQVLAGPDQGEDKPDCVGKHLFDDIYAEDDGKAFSLANAIDAFEVPNDDDGFDTEDFIGQRGRVSVTVETYTKADGTEVISNKIEKYLGPVARRAKAAASRSRK